jgi:hypothetical protein
MICVIFLAPKLAKILAKNTAIYDPKVIISLVSRKSPFLQRISNYHINL